MDSAEITQEILSQWIDEQRLLTLLDIREEEERKNMVRIAEMQKALVKDEAVRLEGMAEWKARILGSHMDDVI